MISTLRLFNGVIVDDKTTKGRNDYVETEFQKETMKKGYIIDEKIYSTMSFTDIDRLHNVIETEVLTSYENWNNAFYKSWSKLETLSDLELRVDQLLHYFTTYGFEALGINNSFVYIPEGTIDLPELDKDLSFLYIKALSWEEVKGRLDSLIGSGVAMSEQTQLDIMEVYEEIGFDASILEVCKNKELKTRFYEKYDLVPKNATEFLRYVIMKSTGNSLVIKDKATIESIKIGGGKKEVLDTFTKYENSYGLTELASSFYRYKPLWLAFKSYTGLSPMINKIRRLAVNYHKPMKADLLNDLTGMLNRKENISYPELNRALDKANSFRKIRLLYALQNRKSKNTEVVYRIRNGKSYATNRVINSNLLGVATVRKIVYSSLVKDLKEKVENKLVYLSPNINYALPATEKQFVGNFPTGTSVAIDKDKDVIMGVHWTNQQQKRVDLDLSLIDISGNKYGWDGSYRNSNRSVMFSGDFTNAPLPKGATELYYFKGIQDGSYLVNINYYNSLYSGDGEDVPFDIVVGGSVANKSNRGFMISPNEIVAQVPSFMGNDQQVIGLVIIKEGQGTFYFAEAKVGVGRTSRGTDTAMIHQKFLVNTLEDTIDFEKLLLDAGALTTRGKEDNPQDIDFDFSVESISKDSILELFY